LQTCLPGTVELVGTQIFIVSELIDTRSGGPLWGDHQKVQLDAVHNARGQSFGEYTDA
jgi:TolB-like protein